MRPDDENVGVGQRRLARSRVLPMAATGLGSSWEEFGFTTSPPGYYDRGDFDIHGIELRARGYNLQRCIYTGQVCRTYAGKPKAEATAQAHAIRKLSSMHGRDRDCQDCDRFQHVRNIFWEVRLPSGSRIIDGIREGLPGGRVDILVKQDDRTVDIYEVKVFGGTGAAAQRDGYIRWFAGSGVEAESGVELLSWSVNYRIDGTGFVAWQMEVGIVRFTPLPDDEEARDRCMSPAEWWGSRVRVPRWLSSPGRARPAEQGQCRAWV